MVCLKQDFGQHDGHKMLVPWTRASMYAWLVRYCECEYYKSCMRMCLCWESFHTECITLFITEHEPSPSCVREHWPTQHLFQFWSVGIVLSQVTVHFIIWFDKTCPISEMWGWNFKKSAIPLFWSESCL